jgi:hypothetical protein
MSCDLKKKKKKASFTLLIHLWKLHCKKIKIKKGSSKMTRIVHLLFESNVKSPIEKKRTIIIMFAIIISFYNGHF